MCFEFFLHQTSWKTRESTDSPPCNCQHLFLFHSQDEMLKTQRFFFTFFIFGRHLESIILYCVGQFKMKKVVLRAGETIIFCHPEWNLWWKHFASTGSFASTSNDFRWFLHGICLFGQKPLASIFSSFLVCASVATYYQRDIKLTFALVHNMCKRSNIFYERNIKLVFAHIDNMCKSSNIFYMNLWTKHQIYVRAHEQHVQA